MEVTDENRDASQAAKAMAVEAISEGSPCVSMLVCVLLP